VRASGWECSVETNSFNSASAQGHTVAMGAKGIRRRKPRRPLPPASDDGQPLVVAGAPDENSTMTPYGVAMGEATFFGNLIRRLTGQRRRRD
jgi:hypothetical protein